MGEKEQKGNRRLRRRFDTDDLRAQMIRDGVTLKTLAGACKCSSVILKKNLEDGMMSPPMAEKIAEGCGIEIHFFDEYVPIKDRKAKVALPEDKKLQEPRMRYVTYAEFRRDMEAIQKCIRKLQDCLRELHTTLNT